jgi:long-chain acyl-CoA synthetase
VQQAGGKLSAMLIQELQAALPEAYIYVMYGQTEATARFSYLPPALLPSKLGSIGRGIPGVELRVVNESGAEVLPGEVAEILARGDSICPGYWNDAEATAERFPDGVLHTSDLAMIDEDGCLYVVDRKSDFIKCYGYRVSSLQVETCLQELPEVVNAAVVGVTDLARGEAIVAFVTSHSRTCLEPEDILAHCARRLACHMVPKTVFIEDRLPMNSQGKVMKTELRRRALEVAAPAEAGLSQP